MKKPLEMLMKIDLNDFSGRWVAIKGSRVVFKSSSASGLLKHVKDNPRKKFVVLKVPEKNQTLIL